VSKDFISLNQGRGQYLKRGGSAGEKFLGPENRFRVEGKEFTPGSQSMVQRMGVHRNREQAFRLCAKEKITDKAVKRAARET